MIDAYAAGLVDGEGCIYIQDSTRKGAGRRAYSATVEIGMAEKAKSLLTAMQRVYGGTVKPSRPASDRWAASHAWVASGTDAERCLERLLSHLVLKKEQARLALLVQQIRRELIPAGGTNARWTDEAAMRCETIRAAVQELNHKGPDVPVPTPPIRGRFLARRVGATWVTNQGSLFSDTGWEPFSGPWPTSGFGGPTGFWTRDTSESPSNAVASSLSDVLETDPIPEKYFLTPVTAASIIRRAKRHGRELPPALEASLHRTAGSSPTPSPDEGEPEGWTTTLLGMDGS
jgi:hypothetical protein